MNGQRSSIPDFLDKSAGTGDEDSGLRQINTRLSPKFCLKTFSSTRSYVDCG